MYECAVVQTPSANLPFHIVCAYCVIDLRLITAGAFSSVVDVDITYHTDVGCLLLSLYLLRYYYFIAGKTESTKLMIQHIAQLCQHDDQNDLHDRIVKVCYSSVVPIYCSCSDLHK